MQNPLLLAVFVLAIFLFIVFNVVSRIFYKRRHGDKYHFYQMFPYEFNYPAVFKENPYGNFLFIMASLSIAVFYILNPYNSIYRIMALIAALAFTMILICIIMMPLYYLKTHMALSIVSMTLAMALPLFNLLMAYNQYKVEPNNMKQVLMIISMVFSGILALIMIALILNPRLTFKIYLDKETDSNGQEVLKRPKIIPLALTEWVSILVYFLSTVSVVLINLL